MEGKQSFVLYKSFYKPTKGLSLEQKGMLYDAIFNYQIEGIEPEPDSEIIMAFMFFQNQFTLAPVPDKGPGFHDPEEHLIPTGEDGLPDEQDRGQPSVADPAGG